MKKGRKKMQKSESERINWIRRTLGGENIGKKEKSESCGDGNYGGVKGKSVNYCGRCSNIWEKGEIKIKS